MSDLTMQTRRADMRRNSESTSSSRAPLEPHEVKKRKTHFPSIVWPLVIISLIQLTSNLVSHSKQTPYTIQTSHLCHSQPQGRRVCHANEIFDRMIEVQNNGQHISYATVTLADKLLVEVQRTASKLNCATDSCSSSQRQVSSPGGLFVPLTHISSHLNGLASNIYTLLSQISSALTFGPHVLLADAAQVMSNPSYQANHDKEIIVLNSTNFNAELIQYNHPFLHIKLIEYYLAYCGICLRFKPTYIQLSKDIYPWRNVIRTAAIDLGVSSNTPVANTWSIDVIPLLRIHPPPSSSLSAELNKKVSANLKLSNVDQLKSISERYKAANLTIGSLGVTKYTYDAKKENLAEKVASLKLDLVRYIEDYVANKLNELPATWPNLRPVTEKTLIDLRRNHPRQELFLVVEAGSGLDPTSQPSLGLQTLMELSSGAAFKAIRYVRAGDNEALIKDVISYKSKESAVTVTDGQDSSVPSGQSNNQVDLLQKILDDRSTNRIVLIHIDDSRSPYGHASDVPSNKFPFITIVTGADLITAEQQYKSLDARAKRDVAEHEARYRHRRALNYEDDSMSPQRRLSLIAHYINQTYIETQEDREFMKALKSYDENPTKPDLKRDDIEKFQATQKRNQISLNQKIENSRKEELEKRASNSTFKKVFHRIKEKLDPIKTTVRHEDDYEDKLKAIRYIFFQEVSRKTLANKSPSEKIEKVKTLINLASVIKAYFPLPDLASVQFMDGILSYLTKQQELLSQQSAQQDAASSLSFDFRAFNKVIKNLEADGKRLPEVKDWKLCKFGGYPCALWRLFHTLTAFEYKKLSQISQHIHSESGQVSRQNLTLLPHTSSGKESSSEQEQLSQEAKALPEALANNNGLPVERVVSPPSTTTSLSLTIATPITAQDHMHASSVYQNRNNNGKQVPEEHLPEPVLLVMRDYITNFFSCEECAQHFGQESSELTSERIRYNEPAEFSTLWLWETHNRVSKRLSVNPDTNPPEHPKKWYPSYEQCSACYKKPPSYLRDTNIELAAIFHESIDWNREEILNFLISEFTQQPMDKTGQLFGYPLPYGCSYIIVIGLSSLLLMILLRCASCYIERQRRHKATLLNGNGAQYSQELQGL